MPAAWVLDEDDALDLLALLVTAARTQVDEAGEYGPLRLLTAAHRLAEAIGPRASEETARFLAGPLREVPPLAVPRCDGEDHAERVEYVERLDGACAALAAHLVARYDPAP